MITPLRPVNTAVGKTPSLAAEEAHIDVPFFEKLLAAWRYVVFSFPLSNQQSFLLECAS